MLTKVVNVSYEGAIEAIPMLKSLRIEKMYRTTHDQNTNTRHTVDTGKLMLRSTFLVAEEEYEVRGGLIVTAEEIEVDGEITVQVTEVPMTADDIASMTAQELISAAAAKLARTLNCEVPVPEPKKLEALEL